MNIPYDSWSSSIYTAPNSIWLFSSGWLSKENMFRLVCYNFDNKTEPKYFFKTDYKKAKYQAYGGINCFDRIGDTISFHMPLDNYIYYINKGKAVKPKFYINYGKNGIPDRFLDGDFYDVMDFHSKLNERKYLHHKGKIFETQNHIIVESHRGKDSFYLIYCKKSQNVKLVKSFFPNFVGVANPEKLEFRPSIIGCENNYIYIQIEPELFAQWYKIELLDSKENNFQVSNTGFSNIKFLLERTSKMDNPFIMKCELKLF